MGLNSVGDEKKTSILEYRSSSSILKIDKN